MVLQILTDVEELLVQGLLRPSTDMQDRFGDSPCRVYTRIPASPVYPLCVVRRLGGSLLTSRPAWVDRARIQYDIWSDLPPPEGSGSLKSTWRDANTLRVLLMSAAGDYTPHGRVTGITESIAPHDIPNPDSSRVHVVGEVIVAVHPLAVTTGP